MEIQSEKTVYQVQYRPAGEKLLYYSQFLNHDEALSFAHEMDEEKDLDYCRVKVIAVRWEILK